MDINNIIIFLACIFAIVMFGKIFLFSFRKILKLLFNSIIGGILIFVINKTGILWGLHIGLNIITSIIVRNIRNTRSYIVNSSKFITYIAKK